MSVTISEVVEIHNKAKSKADGIFSHKGIPYRVVSGEVTHFADIIRGEVLVPYGHFNVVAGNFRCGWKDAAKKLLKSIK